jgi:hypothetical protein
MGERRFVARSDLGRGCEASYDRGMLSGSPTVMRLSAGRRELSRRRAAAWFIGSAVAAAVAVSAGCSEDRLPAPHARTGTSASTTGVGGAGAAPDAGLDAGPGPANLCECVAAYGGVDGPCADCFNDQAAAGAPCDAERAGCTGDPSCRAISLCLKECGSRDPACQSACVFPEDAGAPHRAFQRVLACVCAACGATCAYGAPLECADRDAGGGGGTGGGGGAGG